MVSLIQDASIPFPVLVCESDEIMVRLLAADLRRQDQFIVTESSTGLEQIVSAINDFQPSVLVFGLRARDSADDAVRLLRRVHLRFLKLRTIVLSEETGRDLILDIFRSGAKGFFERSSYDPMLLCRCIRRVAEGQIWCSSDRLNYVLEAFAYAPVVQEPKRFQTLTPREWEVAQAVSDGLSNLEVAQRLGLSIHTVKNYIFNIFDKLGVSSRAELILYLVSNADPEGHPRPSVRVRRNRVQGRTRQASSNDQGTAAKPPFLSTKRSGTGTLVLAGNSAD